MTTVITSMWGTAYERYGARFLESAAKFWAPDVRLIVMSDGMVPRSAVSRPGDRLLDMPPDWGKFRARHADNPAANGRAVSPKWKPKDRVLGYNWRFDAVKWCAQAFVPEAAAALLPDGELMVWLDADVVTFAPLAASLFEDLVGDADGAYLGRGQKHSEIGFWAVRLSPQTRNMIALFARLYRDDQVFALKETHSAFVWDEARRACERDGLRMRDLTPGGRGHVYPNSPLGKYLDHCKGQRKLKGYSKERRAA